MKKQNTYHAQKIYLKFQANCAGLEINAYSSSRIKARTDKLLQKIKSKIG
jgi:tRNA threonylcarbamoyladenosine modification (KEOPS) complex  Pcc1 subunit